MPQYDFQIADYERIFRKRYKLVLLAVLLAICFSYVFTKMKPPLYEATATVKVDRNTVMGLGMESVIYGVWDNIETQTKVITSFPVLMYAAKHLGLIADSVPEDIHPSDERIFQVVEDLKSKVQASSSSGTNIIKISSTSGKPSQAREIANAMAFAYKQFSIDGKKLHAMKTRKFVEQQLELCRADLAEAEQAIKTFGEQQRIPSVDVNARRIMDEALRMQDRISENDRLSKAVDLQIDRLAQPIPVRSDSTRAAQGDSLQWLDQMQWISDLSEKDPGLARLNNRLIQLQIDMDDQAAYYRKDHPASRSLDKKLRETIAQMTLELKGKRSELVRQRQDLTRQRDSIEVEVQKLPSSEMEYARLVRTLKVKEELFTMLAKQKQEAMIVEAGVVDDVIIMSLAPLPRHPTNKNATRMASVGIFLGLIFGVILAVIREMFDTSIGTIEDVERTLKISVLAVIPHIHGDDQKEKGKNRRKPPPVPETPAHAHFRQFLVTHFNHKDPTAEAYRILRTNLEYLSFTKKLQTILLTSATMQEGKSTTISNLAVTFAQQGKRMVLLECNLRRPSLTKMFGIDKGPGTSDVLIGKVKWQSCVKTVTDLALGEFAMEEILRVPGLDNFHLIPYGHRPPNPAELLSSSKMDELLRELRDHFEIVLVDAPPLLPVADSMVISTKVDGVVMIYKVGKAPRNSLRLAKERLETVHANILGLVLNDIRPETTGLTYSSYYMYAYGKDSERKKQRPKIFGVF